jgi:hypothetical protein
MTKVVCENCRIEIDVPEGYSAPFLQCPECGSMQKYHRNNAGEPRFKVLSNKNRVNVTNKIPEERPNKTTTPPPAASYFYNSAIAEKFNENAPYRPIDQKKMIIDSVGEEGLQIAYKLVGNYLWSTSLNYRKNGRAKAIRSLMKKKYPLEMASRAIEFAEKSPEGQAYAKRKLVSFIVVFVLVVVGAISILLAFL